MIGMGLYESGEEVRRVVREEWRAAGVWELDMGKNR